MTGHGKIVEPRRETGARSREREAYLKLFVDRPRGESADQSLS